MDDLHLCSLTLDDFLFQMLIRGAEFSSLLPYLLSHSEKINKHRHLRLQDFWNKRLEQVIDGPQRIASDHIRLIRAERGEKNDGDMLGSFTCPNQCRRLEPI